MLTACSSGNTYQKDAQWDYSENAVQTAEEVPKPIKDTKPPAALETVEQERIAAPSESINTASNTPIVKVALLAPLSGKHAKLGQAMLNAAQLALFDIGYSNFQLIPKDTSGTPGGAREAARQAIDEDAQMILGPLFAESVRAAKPIASNARINMLAFSTDWTLAGNNTFIMGFLPFDQLERLTKYVAANNYSRIGILAPNDNYGRVVTNAFNNLASRYRLQTVKAQNFNPRSRDLASDIRRFSQVDTRRGQETPPPYDAVLMPVGGQTAITVTNLMTQFGLPPNRVKRLSTGLMDDTGLAGEPGLNGTWFAAPSPNLRRNFEKKYFTTYGRKAPRLATLAYDATALSAVLAQKGIAKTGRPAFDKASLLSTSGFFGIDGIFRFRPDGTAERGLAILEFSRGRINVIDEAPTTFQRTQF